MNGMLEARMPPDDGCAPGELLLTPSQRERITGKSHLSGQTGRLLGSRAIGDPTPEI